MPLAPGSRIGPYEVTAPLGAGGMGEVYRARDTKLGRDVALKILPATFAGDPDRLMRFEREAKTLAALNHPHVAQIHGFEQVDATSALVMELVEGEDLAQRIARGPVPLDEALPIARQIAEALEAAHEQGIIHRDLKPANIKLRPDGTVKVLDFGLAKAMEPAGASSANAANSPTLSIHATHAGIVLGTAAYMAPEQARGKAVDKRADIWAFGCVLFEMLTGRRAFDAEDVTDTIVAVMSREPNWSALPAAIPEGVRHLLARCLTKDSRARLRDIGEARVQIGAWRANGERHTTDAAIVHAPRSRWTGALPWTIAGASLLVGAMGVLSSRGGPGAPADRPLVRLVVSLGDAVSLPELTSVGRAVAISPDGMRFAWVSGNPQRLFTRRLDQTTVTEVAGSEGAFAVYFSPDGQWIAFVARGRVQKVSVQGGAAIPLTSIGSFAGASWAGEGHIVLSEAMKGRGILRVSATGAEVEELAPFAESPFVLPGNRGILVRRHRTDGVVSIELLQTASHTGKLILHGGSAPRYLAASETSGYLIYNNRSTLFAVPFDLAALETRGSAVPLIDDLAYSTVTGNGQFDLSPGGMLVYRRVRPPPKATIGSLGADGRMQTLGAAPPGSQGVSISPEGPRAPLTVDDGSGSDVWVYDLVRQALTRVTAIGARDAAWSPDGRRLVVSVFDRGLFHVPADGSAPPQPLTGAAVQQYPGTFTPDGSRFLFVEASGTREIWSVPIQVEGGGLKAGQPEGVLTTPFSYVEPAVSPDGRWLAFMSEESGTAQIYVRPFSPSANGEGQRWQVSTAGGQLARWSRDGRRIIYQAGGRLMSVSYTVRGEQFVPEIPRVWIDALGALPAPRPEAATWDLWPDGARAIVLAGAPVPPDREVVLVLSFGDELRRRVPLPK